MIDLRQELALEQEVFDIINNNIKELERKIKRDQMDAIAAVGHCYIGAFDDAPDMQDKLELLKAHAKISADKIAELKKRIAAGFSYKEDKHTDRMLELTDGVVTRVFNIDTKRGRAQAEELLNNKTGFKIAHTDANGNPVYMTEQQSLAYMHDAQAACLVSISNISEQQARERIYKCYLRNKAMLEKICRLGGDA